MLHAFCIDLKDPSKETLRLPQYYDLLVEHAKWATGDTILRTEYDTELSITIAEESEGAKYFGKLFRNNSSESEILPSGFIESHYDKGMKELDILLSFPCAPQTLTWKVKISLIGESYRFTTGWDVVIQNLGIKDESFLLFEITGTNSFQMRCFEEDGLEFIGPDKLKGTKTSNEVIVIESDSSEEAEADSNGDESDTEDDSLENDSDESFFGYNVTCEITVPDRLRIPASFVKIGKFKKDMDIEFLNDEGEAWKCVVRAELNGRYRRFNVNGWQSFVQDNKLVKGDKCLLVYYPNLDQIMATKME
ncbi:hypothetical protein QVD17_32213 [Tagetes erecta]|uniref:TF-B3 domain-containing protein n=1 Tax=Tagetes erecta TaxID=13708 RepID=A0AAD8K583_TARER|nr:hypothetical protein QVD17_32213 [Tagetes erecta]